MAMKKFITLLFLVVMLTASAWAQLPISDTPNQSCGSAREGVSGCTSGLDVHIEDLPPCNQENGCFTASIAVPMPGNTVNPSMFLPNHNDPYSMFGGSFTPIPCPSCHHNNSTIAAEGAQFVFTQAGIAGFSWGLGGIFDAIGAAAIPDTASLGLIHPPLDPFFNVVGTTATFEAAEVGETLRTLRSPRSPMRFDGKTIGISDYFEKIDESGMWRISNHGGMMGTSNWTMPAEGTDVGGGFLVYDEPVTGWVNFNNMYFSNGSTPLNSWRWLWEGW